jgi:tetratricopeptide (TPR) repeat protein
MTILDKILRKNKKDNGNNKNGKPANAMALINEGNDLIERREYAEAVKCYNKAIKLTPDSTNALNNKGLALARMEKFPDAVACYNKALKINTEDVEIIFNKGIALERLCNYGKALRCYDDILDKKPGDADAWCGRGDVLFGRGSFEEALLAYERALEIAPDDVTILNNRGLLLYKLNRFTEAVESYSKAIEINPKIEKIRSNKNTALAKIKEGRPNTGSLDVSVSVDEDGKDSQLRTQDKDNENFVLEQQPELPEFEPDYDFRTVIPVEVTIDTRTEPVAEFWKQDEDNENFVVEPQLEMPEPEPDYDFRTIIPVEVKTDDETEPDVELAIEPELEPENLAFETQAVLQPDFHQPEPDTDTDSGFAINLDDIPVTESGSFEPEVDENSGVADSEFWKHDEDNENFVVESQPELPEFEPDSDFRTVIPVEVRTDTGTEPDIEWTTEPELEPENLVFETHHSTPQPDFNQPEPDTDFGFAINLDDIPVTESSSFEPEVDENSGVADSEFWKQDEDNENFVVEPQHGIPEPELDSDFRTIIPVELTKDTKTEPDVESAEEPELESENLAFENHSTPQPDFNQPEPDTDFGFAINLDDIPVTESGSFEPGIDENSGAADSEFWKHDEDNENFVVEPQHGIPEPEPDYDFRTIIPVEVRTDTGTEPDVESAIKPKQIAPETQFTIQPDIRHHEKMNKPEEHILSGNSLFSKRKYKEAMDSYHKFALSGLDD